MSRNHLSGDLGFIDLSELLQLLGTIGKSGTLHLNSPWSNVEGRIDFIGGVPVDATDGFKKGLDGLYALFGWKDGRFSFSNHTVSSPAQRIKKDRMKIILDATRLLDEGQIKVLGPLGQDPFSQSDQKANLPTPEKMPLIRGDAPDYSDIVDEERFADGQPIFLEGKFGRWIYVILDGKADVIKKTPRGPLKLVRLGPGTYPGTIMFFTDDKTRETSVVASGQTHLGVINSERVYAEFSSKTPAFQSLAVGMSRRLKKMTETAVTYSRQRRLSKIDFQKMTPITLPGGNENQLMMIKNGTGYLTVNRGGHIIHLATLSTGDLIGDPTFADSTLKMTGGQIYGSDDLDLITLGTHSLVAEYDQCSPTLAAMFKNQAVLSVVIGWLACRFYAKMIAGDESSLG